MRYKIVDTKKAALDKKPVQSYDAGVLRRLADVVEALDTNFASLDSYVYGESSVVVNRSDGIPVEFTVQFDVEDHAYKVKH